MFIPLPTIRVIIPEPLPRDLPAGGFDVVTPTLRDGPFSFGDAHLIRESLVIRGVGRDDEIQVVPRTPRT